MAPVRVCYGFLWYKASGQESGLQTGKAIPRCFGLDYDTNKQTRSGPTPRRSPTNPREAKLDAQMRELQATGYTFVCHGKCRYELKAMDAGDGMPLCSGLELIVQSAPVKAAGAGGVPAANGESAGGRPASVSDAFRNPNNSVNGSRRTEVSREWKDRTLELDTVARAFIRSASKVLAKMGDNLSAVTEAASKAETVLVDELKRLLGKK